MAKSRDDFELERGSGNVYSDLGIPDAQSRQLRAKLAAEIMGVLRRRKLSQRKAAALTGLSQPDISRLNNADLSRFTLDRLVGVLNRLDRRVDLRVGPAKARRRSAKALENA